MEKITVDQIKEVLSKINYPGFTRDIEHLVWLKILKLKDRKLL